MPTMKTGAGSLLPARGPPGKARVVKGAMLASTKARCASRENGWLRDSICARRPNARTPGVRGVARPEFGKIVVRHDLMLGNRLRAHRIERGLHPPAASRAASPLPSPSASKTCRQCHNGEISAGIGPSDASASRTALASRNGASCSNASDFCKCQCRSARGSPPGVPVCIREARAPRRRALPAGDRRRD